MSVERVTSVQRFARMALDLQQEIRRDAIEALNDEADQLVEQMQTVAPEGPTGNLKKSIRKEPGDRDTRVKIKAGGPLTTTTSKGGAPPYDYANAIEFGTQQAGAHPFFWPSWRLRRRRIRGRMKRQITKDIKQRSAE